MGLDAPSTASHTALPSSSSSSSPFPPDSSEPVGVRRSARASRPVERLLPSARVIKAKSRAKVEEKERGSGDAPAKKRSAKEEKKEGKDVKKSRAAKREGAVEGLHDVKAIYESLRFDELDAELKAIAEEVKAIDQRAQRAEQKKERSGGKEGKDAEELRQLMEKREQQKVALLTWPSFHAARREGKESVE